MTTPRTRLKTRHCFFFAIALTAAAQIAVADQEIAKGLPRIGLLSWAPCDRSAAASQMSEWTYLLQGLQELGYTPGENVIIDCRSVDEHYERFAPAAAELAEIPVDVIVTTSEPAVTAAALTTHVIPVISNQSSLFYNSFAEPAGNVTGVVDFAIELTGKRLELLKEAIPTIRQIGVLANPRGIYRTFEARTRRAAQELDLGLKSYRVTEQDSLEDTFELMKAEHVDAVFILPDLMFASQASHIAELALKHRLPTMVWDSQLTNMGFLLAYSSISAEREKRLAFYVDRVLNGASTERLPIEQPANFSLSINLRTARALGVSLPPTLLIMADEVVE